ncbi:hypothetical protein [Actinopolyspora saharensis]|uniref:hypothetical protein n=1 Tax=Actinopolyspora saharensis TaxID=995062 RepID=UPI003F676E17
MDSAKPNGWSGELDDAPEETPAPRGGAPERRCVRLTECRAARAGAPPAGSSSAEEDVLQKFDLGMVPASVTPPQSWRRAGWFAVLSSAATLGGIVLATVVLAPQQPIHHTAEVPHMPRGDDYPRPAALSDPSVPGGCVPVPPPRTPRSSSESSPADPSTSSNSTDVRAVSPRHGDSELPSGEQFAPQSTESDSGSPEAGPDADSPPDRQVPTSTGSTSSRPTPAESVTALAEQQHTATTRWSRMRRLTERYFSEIAAGDLRSAHRMTGGRLRRADFAEFSAPYRGAEEIEVVATTAATDSTVTELRIERDGTTRTTHRRLRFDEDRRRVIADAPLSDGAPSGRSS